MCFKLWLLEIQKILATILHRQLLEIVDILIEKAVNVSK